VSKAQTLAKLHALLARVRARAGESRIPQANGPAASAMPAPQSPPAVEPVELSTWSPPALESAAREPDIEVEVDYVETTPISASGPAHGTSESVERLVAAQPTAPEGLVDPAPSTPESASAEPPASSGAVEAEAVRPPEDVASPLESEAGADEEEPEPGPASSRRPVMMTEPEERLEQMAFGTAETPPPRHTPPPESGRMPAAPAMEPESDATGLREVVSPAVEPPPSPVVQLVPQPTRAALDSRDDIAEVIGEAQAFQPASFSALLDATMAL
jgi:hypothetical protein